jgi:phospholipase C
LLGACGGAPDAASQTEQGLTGAGGGGGLSSVKNVFVILMENHNWSSVKGSGAAPYINNTLLPMGAHAENYVNVPGIHPSEPNYIWLEAGDNFGVANDDPPSNNHQSTKDHLTNQLEAAGISWKEYAEGIGGSSCPVTANKLYAPKHVPFVFFDDVINDSSRCTSHVRPYSELATDLSNGSTARYNFITPDLCDDMHDSSGCATKSSLANGDAWLARELPKIFASNAYKSGGAVFITWDESEQGDHPIGMIVLSPFAKAGYAGTVSYSHSSTLRTVQTIFGVQPFLGDAANANDLSDLFQ